MKKEQINTLVLQTADTDEFCTIPEELLCSFTHAFLGELAKEAEPVAWNYELEHAAFTRMCSKGFEADTPLYTIPLPAPDLAAENARLNSLNIELTAKCNWYNVDGARLERERDAISQQLSAAKLEIQQVDKLREIQFDEFTKQLAAAQSCIEEIRKGLIQMRCPDFFDGVSDGYEKKFDDHLKSLISKANGVPK